MWNSIKIVRKFVALVDMGKIPLSLVDSLILEDVRRYAHVHSRALVLTALSFVLTFVGIVSLALISENNLEGRSVSDVSPVFVSGAILASTIISLGVFMISFVYSSSKPDIDFVALGRLLNQFTTLKSNLEMRPASISRTTSKKDLEVRAHLILTCLALEIALRENSHQVGSKTESMRAELNRRYDHFLELKIVPEGGIAQYFNFPTGKRT